MLASSGVALALVEIGLRLFLPQPLSPAKINADCTVVHLASTTIHMARADWAQDVSFNRLGLRDVDHGPRRPGVTRVLVLGDSFTEAFQVSFDEAFVERLQARWGEQVEVINAGVSSTGPDDQLLLFRRLVDKLQPNLVLLAMFDGNDLTDVASKGYFRLDEHDGLVKVVGECRPRPVRDWLAAHSHLYQFVRDRLHRKPKAGVIESGRAPVAGAPSLAVTQADTFARTPTPATTSAWKLTAALLRALRDESAAHGAALAVAVLPMKDQLSDELFAAYAKSEGRTDLDRAAPERILSDIARTLQVPLVDVLPAFSAARDPRALYFPTDGHFTAAGHALTAETIAGALTPAGSTWKQAP